MEKFRRTLLALLRTYFITVGVMVTLSFCLLLFALARFDFHSDTPRAELPSDGAVLLLGVGGELRSWRARVKRRSFLPSITVGIRATWVSEMQRVLAAARDDERIKAVLLDLSEGLQGSLVDFAALREVLAAFVVDSDKELVCFLAVGDNHNYLLASAADRVVLNPVTMLEITGPVLHLTYFGSALKKLGVGVEVVQTGDYKSAFEPFVKDQPSSAALEMYRNLEQSLRNQLVTAIADGRQRSEPEAREWLARSIFSATEAQARGVVDSIGHRDDALAALKEKLQVEEHISYRAYLAAAEVEEPVVIGNGGLGLVEMEGVIAMNGDEWNMILPRRVVTELEWMRDNDDVAAVVLRVDSPGGSAVASELIWKEVTRLTARKPVVVSMGEVAASGGYYLAAGASYLLAEPATITGSIGVIGMIPNFEDFQDEYGVSFYVVTASERRALYNTGSAMSAADRRIVRHNLQEVYRVFKERVSAGRGLALEELEQLAGGRVFTGAQAVKAGLVDELGGIDTAFSKAKELAQLDPERKYPLYRYDHGRLSFFNCLRATMDIERCLAERFSRTAISLRHYLRLLTHQGAQLLALWPHAFSR